MSTFEVVIGLEIHAQLQTKTKLFCGCSTQFGQEPNTHTCPVCLGLPGALPVLNKAAIQMAIQAGLALGCSIQNESVFSRKNYFYPDLPKGYQISQFDKPICLGGSLTIDVNGTPKTIGITRIHMEEDAGKLVHQGADAIAGATYSLVDLNRACTPLIEIVSEPDIRSALEARLYMENLKQILEHIGVCDGNLDEGSMRADANISIRPIGQKEFGTRTEVKNLNSFRSIERAILYEIERQKEVVLSGGKIIQQTMHYDDNTQKTVVLRSKENAHDYRYFPEPDLLPLVVTQAQIETLKAHLPELPQARITRYQSEHALSKSEAEIVVGDLDIMAFFESALALQSPVSAKDICKWTIGDVLALNKETKHLFSTSSITPKRLLGLLELIQAGTLSGKMAKEVLLKMADSTEDPADIVKKMGVTQISDTSQLDAFIHEVLNANPDVIEKVKSGKTNSADFLIGQVMKLSRGQAKPDLVRTLLLEAISNR